MTQKLSPDKNETKSGDVERIYGHMNLGNDSENFVCDTQLLREIESKRSIESPNKEPSVSAERKEKEPIQNVFMDSENFIFDTQVLRQIECLGSTNGTAKQPLGGANNMLNEDIESAKSFEFPKPERIGFSSASGHKIKLPSKESLQKVRKQFESDLQEAGSFTVAKQCTGLMTASGGKIALPSTESLEKVRGMYN